MKYHYKNYIATEVKSFYINQYRELYVQINKRMGAKATDVYTVGEKVKLLCYDYTISGTISDITKAGLYLTNWYIGVE